MPAKTRSILHVHLDTCQHYRALVLWYDLLATNIREHFTSVGRHYSNILPLGSQIVTEKSQAMSQIIEYVFIRTFSNADTLIWDANQKNQSHISFLICRVYNIGNHIHTHTHTYTNLTAEVQMNAKHGNQKHITTGKLCKANNSSG